MLRRPCAAVCGRAGTFGAPRSVEEQGHSGYRSEKSRDIQGAEKQKGRDIQGKPQLRKTKDTE